MVETFDIFNFDTLILQYIDLSRIKTTSGCKDIRFRKLGNEKSYQIIHNLPFSIQIKYIKTIMLLYVNKMLFLFEFISNINVKNSNLKYCTSKLNLFLK